LQQESSQGSFWKAILAAFIVSAVASNAVADEKSKAGTLLVYILSVESSHAKDFERPAGERFDTVQWWVGEGGNWRIKTYAIEADIHPYKLETKMPTAEVLQLAKRNTKKAYGDVIRRLVEVAVPAGLTNDELGKLLKKQGLSASFEWVEAGCLLWKPDEPDYRSQTKPK